MDSIIIIRKIHQPIQHPIQRIKHLIARITVRESARAHHRRIIVVVITSTHAHPRRHACHSGDDLVRDSRVRVGCVGGVVRC
jgi:hypothetical protein